MVIPLYLCPECNIAVDPEWTICPTCSILLEQNGEVTRNPVSEDERYASNLAWFYHLIPVLTGLIALVIGDHLVTDSNPLLRTIFPPFCLVVGGWIGLILLGIIASYKSQP
ncbi:MAG: zinc ribbon domain-containing protein [Euryarchaeota archaeon]|jgi:hypothetical protein|nr:zinc ribbon domain-containing protein [Euryarchaeota archaeon]